MLLDDVNLDIDCVDSIDLEADYKDERPWRLKIAQGTREEGVEIVMDYEAQKRLFLASHDRSPFFSQHL